jgi:hypothetical protein
MKCEASAFEKRGESSGCAAVGRATMVQGRVEFSVRGSVLRRIALDRAIILILFTFTGLRPSDSRKQRSWVEPTNFFEGTIPPKRSGLGITCCVETQFRFLNIVVPIECIARITVKCASQVFKTGAL